MIELSQAMTPSYSILVHHNAMNGAKDAKGPLT
jgi:hypothetical protein